MKTDKLQRQPDPTNRRRHTPDHEIDPKNPWNRPAPRPAAPEQKSQKEKEDQQRKNQQPEQPEAETQRPAITNQDEQRKVTNVDDNDAIGEQGI